MKTSGAVLAGVLLVACGSDAGTPGTDFTCDSSQDRSGVYLVHSVERPGGTCGALTDGLTRFDGGMAVQQSDTQCEALVPTTVTDSGCTFANSLRCAGTDGSVSDVTGTTTQLDASGAKLDGIFSETVTLADGYSCSSTYDVTYTRQ
jgi:hypothetical protein